MNEYKSTLTPEEVDAAFKNMANLENGIAAANSAAKLSQSWAVGGTGTREGEDTNNAQYWAQQAQKVAQGAQGWYETEESLQAAHPTGENGQWAIVGSTDTIWTWDSDTGAWVNTGSQMDLSGYYTKEQSDERYATAAQGKKADTAVQSVNGVQASAGAVTIPVGAMVTLLWEKTENQFVNTITLNSSPEFILIETAGSLGAAGNAYNFNPLQMFDTSNGDGHLYGLGNAHGLQYRVFEYKKTDDSITLTFTSGNADSTHLVPTKVYGIKL